MSYYGEGEELIVVVSAWRVRVGVKRYLGKAVKEVLERIKPEKDQLWKSSRGHHFDGYSATMVDYRASVGETVLEAFYPDW